MKVSGLLFGTAGVPWSARPRTTEAGIERICEMGLGCMEVEFVRGVRMAKESAGLVKKMAANRKVKLTAHGPYYINLNSREQDKVNASQQRILQTARIGWLCGAESVTFHAAFYHSDPPDIVYQQIRRCFQKITGQLCEEDIWIWVRPETMGRVGQFGTLEEVLHLSAEVKGIAPCIDFAHLHARTGELNSYKEFYACLEQVEQVLGRQAVDNLHMHVSGIHYGKKGELKHLNLGESDFHYVELLRALKDFNAGGIVICESPNLEEDALLLLDTYHEMN